MRLQGNARYERNKGNIFESVYTKHNIHNLSEIWGFVAFAVVLAIGSFTHYNLRDRLPNALGNSDLLHNPSSFIAERAWKDLKILTSFGPRPTGTYSNEVLAVDFLKREIAFIKQMAHKRQRIEIDIQTVSGAFHINEMTSVYRNVQNVVVKLHSGLGNNGANSTTALLVNCHYDSVPGSPGASDDAANCAVMLEILRVLSRRSEINTHNIIFLFNGAEETGLQASHGFITQHKWAASINAFLNLESMGSGGRELLFQSSASGSWLIELYRKSATYPSAQVAAEEIFQSGLIPSDTDFRIFHKYGGGIPGLDFAHIINGHRYHTKFDHIDYLSKNSLQHTGENMLELIVAIANSQHLSDRSKQNQRQQHSTENGQTKQVYFDILNIVFIAYSTDFATILNYAIVTSSVLIPYLLLSRALKGLNKKHLRYEIFLGFLINMISLVTSNALCYAIAYDLDVKGKAMSWYSNAFICLPTYCLVTVFVQCAAHVVFNRNSKAPISLALQTQARLIGTSFFWSILGSSLTGAGIRTTYVIIIPLFITLLSHMVIGLCGYQNAIRSWLYVHLIGQAFVLLWTTSLYNMVTDVFIPMAGRSGGSKNPDIMIAIICCCLTFVVTSYLTPLVILFRKCKTFFIAMFSIFIVMRFYFLAFTNYGFPYTDENYDDMPKVQRHYITHAIRTLYDREENIRYTDSGFWFIDFDRNSRKTIESLTVPDEIRSQSDNILCKDEAFCGLPLYSLRQLKPGGFWLPGPAPVVRDVAHLSLIKHERPTSNTHRMQFVLTGNHMVSLHIRLRDYVKLEKWSLTTTLPPTTEYNKQTAYFVMISHGLESSPLNITLELKTNGDGSKRSILDISVVTCHLQYPKDHHTPVFANMLAKLPRWSYPMASVASLKSWTY